MARFNIVLAHKDQAAVYSIRDDSILEILDYASTTLQVFDMIMEDGTLIEGDPSEIGIAWLELDNELIEASEVLFQVLAGTYK